MNICREEGMESDMKIREVEGDHEEELRSIVTRHQSIHNSIASSFNLLISLDCSKVS